MARSRLRAEGSDFYLVKGDLRLKISNPIPLQGVLAQDEAAGVAASRSTVHSMRNASAYDCCCRT